MSGEILDAIDRALLDYAVSGDAMRWTPEPPSGGVYMVRGGSPVALSIASQLDDPEVRERFRRSFVEATDRLVEAFRPMVETFSKAAEQMGRLHVTLREAGVLPDVAPTDDAKARALWFVQHRNTGPNRDITMQRRPRHHTVT